MHPRSMKEVLARSREVELAPLRRGDANHAGEASKLAEKAVKKTAAAVSASAPSPAAASSVSVAGGDDAVDEWSAAQQAQLESALRTVSKTAPDRWDLIAAGVTGKTKKQVLARYKFIKAQIMAGSGASTAVQG